MTTYKRTIVERHREYVDKKLLLADRNMSGLFCKDGYIIEIQFDNNGQLMVNRITKKNLKAELLTDCSLRRIGRDYLGMKDPSVSQMLKYFILPEIEVERIFNNVRYKYLNAIRLSGLTPPHQYMHSDYNRAFQELAGLTVYQGNTPNRRPNGYFCRDAGFNQKACEELNWEEDRNALQFIIRYIKKAYIDDISSAYFELIAVKPGFHEIWKHDNYFIEHSKRKDDVRVTAFRILRCKNHVNEQLSLHEMPPQIRKDKYYTYASCNITEGPLVYRKSISVSYSDKIKEVACCAKKDTRPLEERREEMRRQLREHFNVLDYKDEEELKELIAQAERYQYYMCRNTIAK